MDSLKGQLLISGPGLHDPNFRHTVVLIGEHGPEGAVGVVLNRPLDVPVSAGAPPLAELVGPDEKLFQGGPVEPNQAVLLVETTDPALLDVPVLPSIGFLTGDVPAEVRTAILQARVYAGHAGWGPGQLEAEMKGDSWIVEPATGSDLFTHEPGLLWRRVLERKGPPYAAMARVPFDPSLN